MLNKIRYHDFTDSVWFTSDIFGECDIDKDGDFSFTYEDAGGYYNFSHTFYIPVEELRRIVNLYDNRKSIKNEA